MHRAEQGAAASWCCCRNPRRGNSPYQTPRPGARPEAEPLGDQLWRVEARDIDELDHVHDHPHQLKQVDVQPIVVVYPFGAEPVAWSLVSSHTAG